MYIVLRLKSVDRFRCSNVWLWRGESNLKHMLQDLIGHRVVEIGDCFEVSGIESPFIIIRDQT